MFILDPVKKAIYLAERKLIFDLDVDHFCICCILYKLYFEYAIKEFLKFSYIWNESSEQ